MTMVLGRPLFRNDGSPAGFRGSRPALKLQCARYSTSLDTGRCRYDARNASPYNYDIGEPSLSSPKFGNVSLSTPSPSATANGNRVDIAFEKFRKISEEWLRNREIEEAENQFRESRSPSPQRLFSELKFYQRRSNSQPPENGSSINSRDSRSPSPKRSTERSYRSPSSTINERSYRSPSSTSTRGSESPLRSFRSRSPTPLVFSPVTKTFLRSSSYDESDTNRSSSPSDFTFPPSVFRRSSSYDGDRRYNSLPSRSSSPKKHTPVSSIFRRSNGYDNDEELRRNFRARSTSPQRLTPASSYYRRQGNNDDRDYGPTDNSFLQNTLPDISHYRMASPRRFSEEPSPFRRPLATLHEDEVTARRRFSDDLRKKSYDTSDIMNDYNLHQRKLSEAGVRRLSDFLDASLVLTEDTDSFIIGDRVYVGGTKPGSISYIGETQFAPGEWAGITLDEPIGKNDGTVGGIRYFQCTGKRGVFSRLTRLSRYPLSDYDLEAIAVKQGTTRKRSESPPKGPTPPPCSATTLNARKITPTQQSSDTYRKTSQPSEPVRKITPSSPGSKSPPHGKSGSPSPAGSVKRGPPPSFLNLNTDLILGDRVVIDSTSGTKYGVLRFLGRTEFADGIWAGVELDDASGKNDGSVAGKKYFICRNKYGLFAPMSRVRPFSTRASSAPRSTPLNSRPTPSMRRTNSKESVGGSSVASSNVSVKGTRRPCRSSVTGTDVNNKALQNHHRYDDEDWFY